MTEGKRYQTSALLAKDHSKAAIARVLKVKCSEIYSQPMRRDFHRMDARAAMEP
ncbi:hypothetical protein [uncultured Shewanella sp.]|uniref:hypothetical protein n=1 Tax=uncultured Shewanella sp. TaxID=173975 RepID=UPI002611B846|nr:hypothetical protein [uncultured Shewanella sp.]